MSKKPVITRKELAAELAAKMGLSASHAADILNRTINIIIGRLYQGQTVELRGFGRLEVLATSARPGRNPRTGEPHLIAAGRRVRFYPSRKLNKVLGAAP